MYLYEHHGSVARVGTTQSASGVDTSALAQDRAKKARPPRISRQDKVVVGAPSKGLDTKTGPKIPFRAWLMS